MQCSCRVHCLLLKLLPSTLPLPRSHGAGKADADAAAAALKEARSSSDDRCRSNVPLVIQEAINSERGCN